MILTPNYNTTEDEEIKRGFRPVRHGFGTAYTANGEKIYQGIYSCGLLIDFG
jgi:hypothetical protein